MSTCRLRYMYMYMYTMYIHYDAKVQVNMQDEVCCSTQSQSQSIIAVLQGEYPLLPAHVQSYMYMYIHNRTSSLSTVALSVGTGQGWQNHSGRLPNQYQDCLQPWPFWTNVATRVALGARVLSGYFNARCCSFYKAHCCSQVDVLIAPFFKHKTRTTTASY